MNSNTQTKLRGRTGLQRASTARMPRDCPGDCCQSESSSETAADIHHEEKGVVCKGVRGDGAELVALQEPRKDKIGYQASSSTNSCCRAVLVKNWRDDTTVNAL